MAIFQCLPCAVNHFRYSHAHEASLRVYLVTEIHQAWKSRPACPHILTGEFGASALWSWRYAILTLWLVVKTQKGAPIWYNIQYPLNAYLFIYMTQTKAEHEKLHAISWHAAATSPSRHLWWYIKKPRWLLATARAMRNGANRWGRWGSWL